MYARQMADTLNFEVQGGKKLRGSVAVNTSKNGAMALLCASLLNDAPTTIKRMPKIEEVHRLVEVLESIGVSVEWRGDSVTITPPKTLNLEKLNEDAARKTRSILMFIGPLLHRAREFSIPHSGGCKLGSRTVRPHFFALENLGVTVSTRADRWYVTCRKLAPAEIIMYESSDTATETALMAAARVPGTTVIKYASANYQVQELCFFLELLGVHIEGIGTPTITVHGLRKLSKNVSYSLSEDPIDAMFFIAAAIVTKSSITISGCPVDFLELELYVLEKMGFRYDVVRRYRAKNGRTRLMDITTHPSILKAPEDKVHARPYPGINIDNLPFFAVIATQAKGTTFIHDWVFEKRALHMTELDKLGATTLLADPHRIYITGPTPLKGAELMTPPVLRVGALLLVAMLGASGRSLLRNVYSINRGYEDIVGRLSALGAEIRIVNGG